MGKQKSLSINILFLVLVLIFVEGTIFAINSVRTPKFQSVSKYMVVISDYDKLNSYNSSVAANHLAGLTAELVNTSSFIKKVYNNSGLIYDSRKIDHYRKLINAEIVKETEIVEISVINESPSRAQKINEEIINLLEAETKSANWSQRNFKIELIDPPLAPYSPISPQPIRDFIIGFVAVVMIFSFYYMVRE